MPEKADRIRLNNLLFWGRHGCFPSEQELGNRFEVDVELQVDAARAARLDRIDLTVDLSLVYDAVRRHVEGKPCRLIETLAYRILGDLLKLDKVKAATVRLRKLSPPFSGAIQGVMEVELTRPAKAAS
ncbi:MAG TPA: dihydroneopterin aldolase [bacterium]|jgi:dihydroneopterin aldolase